MKVDSVEHTFFFFPRINYLSGRMKPVKNGEGGGEIINIAKVGF